MLRNLNTNNLSLVERIKRKGSLLYQLFPINHRTKYPIFFDKLLERINNLKLKYNKPYSINVYQGWVSGSVANVFVANHDTERVIHPPLNMMHLKINLQPACRTEIL